MQATRTAPMVVREPEAAWWRVQADLDGWASGGATTTVAVLEDRDAADDSVLASLARLAVADELLVVFGVAAGAYPAQHHMITGLRGRLPRHDVVAMHVRHRGAASHWQAALDLFLDAGRLPVVVTAAAVLQDVTAEISSYVRADRVLRVFGTGTGADLYQVWRRPEPSVN
ncbi:hypothetical protein ACIBSW_12470 [Actinoplanes sp. NPDC049668]|uniref:hypothetical protein n=1 Tax=unclassified Actinoplanes TaxID=2626549 RepID=UPI0033A23628